MSAFNDRPFLAGSLIGMRAFAVDSLGRLTGPLYGQVFTPDENVAECRKEEARTMTYGGVAWMPLLAAPGTCSCGCGMPVGNPSNHTAPPPVPLGRAGQITTTTFKAASEKIDVAVKRLSEAAVEKVPDPPKHTVASVDCTCGFYAYFDGGNDYKERERVTALIEGYGVCTVGSRGFRASKARLVAVIRSDKLAPHLTAALERNYPESLWFDHKRDALSEFPLSVGEIPSPETVEDFWTRSAS